MIIYSLYAFLGIAFFLTFFDITNISDVKRRYLFAFVCLWAILIVTFREGIGFDYDAYIEIYNSTPIITEWKEKWQLLFSGRLTFVEIAYLFINAVVKQIFDIYEIGFFILAIIAFYAYYKAIPQMTMYVFSTFLVYIATVFFYKEMGQIRHGVAMALVLYSIPFLVNNHERKFIVYTTIAMLFHKAVLPVYILLLFKNFKWRKGSAFGILIILILLYNFNFSDFLLNYIGNISIFADQTEAIVKNNLDGIVSIEKFIFPVMTAMISIIFLDSGAKKFSYYHIELTMLLIGIGVMAIFHGYKEFGQRLSAVFILSEILLLPQVCIGVPKSLIGKIIGWLVVLILCGIYIYHTLQTFPL